MAYPDNAPKVLDCFTGGGAIPLEALRLGCETYALDLYSMAHLIELCCLVYPPQFGASLAKDVAEWGRWVIEHIYEELKDLYPTIPDPNSTGPTHAAPAVAQAKLKIAGAVAALDDEGEDDEDEGVRPLVETPPGRFLPSAYLWTRPVPCPNPTCGAEVPILKQTWLVRACSRRDIESDEVLWKGAGHK